MDLSEVDQSIDGATLASVAQHDFRLPPQSPASVLYAEFERDPMLPGAIVSVDEEVIGLVSRQRFFQLLSHRFGASLFLDAPVQKILGAGPHDFLSLDKSMSIHEAARRCLARPRDLVFEPVLVVGPHDKPRLLGMHELLLAQSHQLTLAHDTIQEQISVVEAASQAKGNFLANMSHEIRTPLNAIVGMTELMLDSSLTPRQREYAGTVIDSCENLLAIINDVLDFSKIESGRLDLERVSFDLREHLGDTLKGMAVRACQRGIELAFRCAADVPREVVGDPVRLRQIVLNLVGNAIKFTHQGEVVVDVRYESGQENDAVLHFCVSDTGIGIPPGKIDLIFDAFEQADTSTTREYGGTGLGLAISLRLVHLMQGKLWVQSEVGRGSKFHFTAHVGTVAAQESIDESLDECQLTSGVRVLVVDSHCTSCSILIDLLKSWRMEPRSVACGADALAALGEAASAGRPFALAIIDAELPDGCGFDLIASLRNHATLGQTPVLALIAAERAAVARADRAGVAACLMRPVKQSELLNAVLTALGGRAADEPALRWNDWEEPELPPLKILVGEDSLVNQKLIYEMLSRRGHSVLVAGNGEEVLAHITRDRFDLVLMDVQMPHMDGFEATRRIRRLENKLGRHIPIVAMTAHALPEDRDRCLAAGMDNYVAKPIRTRALIAALATVLREQENAAIGAAPAEISSAENLECIASELPRHIGIDWRRALEELDGNAQVLHIVVEAALEESPRLLATVRTAADARDATQLRLAAHTLKGTLRYFGETSAYDAAQHLERMGYEQNFESVAEACRRLDEELATVIGQMSEYLLADAEPAALV